MKITKTPDTNNIGGSIDSWCGKCRRVLTHRIEVMIGGKPARVHCSKCNTQHAYKAQQPVPSRYKSLFKGKDKAVARTYSSSERYAPGDVMQHASFGLGVATAVKDHTKIEVLFEGGSKVLVHGQAIRSSSGPVPLLP